MSEDEGTQRSIDVLVCGAGPVGLTMAAELTRHGLRCRVVDKSPVASDKSKAIVIWSRTLEMLEEMGEVETFLAAGCRSHGASVYSGAKRLVHLSFDVDSAYNYALMIPQCDTEVILAARVERGGVRIEGGVELTDFAVDDTGVDCTLRRADGGAESVRAAWLVGCDGAHSTVRHRLGVEFSGEAEPNDWLLADVHVSGPLADDEFSIFFHDDGVLVFFPIQPGRFRIVADVGLAAHLEHPADPTLKEVQDVVDRRGIAGFTVSDPIWLAGFRIHERKVGHFRHGRVFLAGDAAHIHSPAGGQGMNIGMQDAYNLAWKLALVARGRGRDRLLDSFDVERSGVAAEVLRNAGVLTRAATLRNPIARQLRNHLYSLFGSLDVVQQRIGDTMAELAFNYRDSPITGEHGARTSVAWLLGGGVHAGDRLPDGELIEAGSGASRRVFDLIGHERHALLLLTGVEAPAAQLASLRSIADAVEARFGDLVVSYVVVPAEEGAAPPAARSMSDPGDALHRRLGAAGPTLYLIRPDGYVGFRSQPADAASLLAHLDGYLVGA